MVKSAIVQTPNTIQESLWSNGRWFQASGTYLLQNVLFAWSSCCMFIGYLKISSSMSVKSARVQVPNTIQASLLSNGSFSQHDGTCLLQKSQLSLRNCFIKLKKTLRESHSRISLRGIVRFVTASRICILFLSLYVFLDECAKIDGLGNIIFLCLFFQIRCYF